MDTRQTMLREAIQKVETTFGGGAWNARHLNAILPRDFWIDPETGDKYSDESIADELHAATADAAPEPEQSDRDPAELKYDMVRGGTVAHAPPIRAHVADIPRTSPPAPQAANDRLVAAAKALSLARVAATQARAALAQARANLTAARVAHAEGSPNTMSFNDNVRDYLEAQAKQKEAAKRGEAWAVKKTRVGRGSYIDVSASYARGTDDVNSAARARNRYGYKRGAYGAERLGTPNFDPARGNVPRKVTP
jgi:hypothetical protein